MKTSFLKQPLLQVIIGKNNANLLWFLGVFVASVVSAALEGVSFGVLLLGFKSANGGLVSENRLITSLYEWIGAHGGSGANQMFFKFTLLSLVFQMFRCVFSILSALLTSSVSIRIQKVAQEKVYNQIFQLAYPFVSKYKVGDLIDHAKNPASVIPLSLDLMNRIFVSFSLFLGLLLMMFLISINLTIVTIACFGVFVLFQKFFIKNINTSSRRLTDNLVELSHQTIQSLQALRLIHTFHRQNYVRKKVFNTFEKIAELSKKIYLWNSSIPVANELINIVFVGVILVSGLYMLQQSDNNILANLITFLALAYRLSVRLQGAMISLGALTIQVPNMRRLNDIMRSDDKEYLEVRENRVPMNWNQIEFRDVVFKYNDALDPALKNFSMKILKGFTTAIVGSSGAGKSTIIDLLLRLYTPTEGGIYLDSENLNSFNLEDWRNLLGVVNQDIFIFDDTIEENIRFGRLNATEAEIIAAAKAAGAHEFIDRLEKKYSSHLGERGYKLSGGEKQRIALARVLLRNTEVLILDEATSNLDSISEGLIQKFLDNNHKYKTILIVAHRLSSVIHADQIVVMDRGCIVETGVHEELLALNGMYARLWQHQLKEAERQKADGAEYSKVLK